MKRKKGWLKKELDDATCLVDIDTLTKKLIERVGCYNVLAILQEYDQSTEGYTKKQLEKLVEKLGVWSEDEIDGG